VSLFLADPMARLPSFPRQGASEYPFPVAVKTGTSSGFHDGWAVAWSKRYLVAAWVGHPDGRAMTGLTGYRSAAELVRPVLLGLHRGDADGLADLDFPPPRGAHAVRLCALSGRRATAACDRVVNEWLAAGAEPVEDCSWHRLRDVDVRSGALADAGTPRRHRQTVSFLELPPRYAEWLASIAAPAALAPAGGPLAPGREHRIAIVSPADGTRLLLDPETPRALATLALGAVVEPPVPELVWYVDGAPFEVVPAPYTVRWPLTPGRHVIEARLAFTAAGARRVRILVE
jgi:penicillin-binding protein 1C